MSSQETLRIDPPYGQNAGSTGDPRKVVLLSDSEQPDEGDMRFRLTYEGPLRSTQGDPRGGQAEPPKRAAHKHEIRKAFHLQLKELWNTNKFLREHQLSRKLPASRPISNEKSYYGEPGDEAPMAEVIADLYQRNGYRFVPLVREEISLLCSLNILFLRRDIPGSVIHAGDIDNRLKTLIDALRMPASGAELVGNETPGAGEDPFYCLLEDDKQVTQLSVETDTLLDPPTDDASFVRLVVTVDIWPYYTTMFNLSFA